nr:TPM domain-containing protein [Tenuifilaceae bacterium]
MLSNEEKKRIVDAIKQAELNTSGEVRVHIESHCKKDVLDRAADVFALLKMHKTQLRNGVLFYLAIKDKQFAVLGDAGINSLVPENFWEEVKDEMLLHFKQGNFTVGLVNGITMAGEKL